MKIERIFVSAILALMPLLLPANVGQDGFRPLFNGETLAGWHIFLEGQGRTAYPKQNIFSVVDGVIHVYKDMQEGSTQPFGGLITNDSYANYHLILEYKWGTTKHAPRAADVRDAGIILHMLEPESIWPDGFECQIQEGDTGDLWLIGTRGSSKVQGTVRNYSPEGSLITRGSNGKRFNRFHRGYCWEKPGWNRIEIVVRDDNAVFIVNGHVVNEAIDVRKPGEATGSWQPLTSGPILLQAEGAEIFYRNIQIKELD